CRRFSPRKALQRTPCRRASDRVCAAATEPCPRTPWRDGGDLGACRSPNVSQLIEHEHGGVAWPTRSLQSTVLNASTEAGRPMAFAEIEPAIPTLERLFGDLMLKRLDAMLVEESDGGSALSIADRQKQGSLIQSDLRAVEYDLGAMVWCGLDERLTVWFDGDQNPMTVIGATLVTHLATNGGG